MSFLLIKILFALPLKNIICLAPSSTSPYFLIDWYHWIEIIENFRLLKTCLSRRNVVTCDISLENILKYTIIK